MKHFHLLILAVFSNIASALPLQTIGTFCGTFPDQCRKGTESLLAARGTGTDAYYVMEVDPTTGALPVDVVGGSFTVDIPSVGPTGDPVPAEADYQGLNNGGVLIGAAGDSSGRTIVVGPGTAGTPTGGVLSVQGVGGGTDLPISGTVTANQGGSPWGVTGSGTAGAPAAGVISVQGITSMTPLLVNGSGSTQPVSGTVTANQGGAPWSVTGSGSAGTAAAGVVTVQGITSMTPLLVDGSGSTQPVSGTVAVSNFPSTVDTNTGAAGASTLRVVTSTRSETATTPLAVRQSNGTSFADYGTGAAASTTLRTVVANDNPAGAGRSYADSVRKDYTSGSVTTGAWVQLIAATAATINCIQLFDSSGQTLELGVGAAAAESRVLIIPPGGLDACVPLRIAAGSRLSVRAISATASVGELDITGLN